MTEVDRDRFTRREFLKAGVSAAVAPAVFGWSRLLPSRRDHLPARVLGRTGARVSILGLGGQILLQTPDRWDEAVELINRALDLGINYCDTAAAYYPSELYYGEVMPERRHEVFLATKTGDRTRDGAWRSIEQSLVNLQTDHVDLIQVHSLDRFDHLDRALQPDGALAAMSEAREQGLTRFIGVSGHNADVLLSALHAFDFDTILVRINPLDPLRGDVIGSVLPVAHRRRMGVIAMKVMDRGGLLNRGVSPSSLLRYTLSQHVATAIVGCGSLRDLEENFETARTFRPLPRRQLRELERIFSS